MMSFDRPLLWKLDDQDRPVACTTTAEWGHWMEENVGRRVVGNDERNGVRVSTIFIGIDSFGHGRLWETMVFGGKHHREQERYSSREDALAGHRLMCEQVFGHGD